MDQESRASTTTKQTRVATATPLPIDFALKSSSAVASLNLTKAHKMVSVRVFLSKLAEHTNKHNLTWPGLLLLLQLLFATTTTTMATTSYNPKCCHKNEFLRLN